MKPRVGARLVLFAGVLLAGCDESPSSPDVPDRLRVGLVVSALTTAQETQWFIYEIDQQGIVNLVLETSVPLQGARYTGFLGTRSSIAYLDTDGQLTARHLASGDESVIDGSFTRPRFSTDGRLLAYSAPVTGEDGAVTEQVFVQNRSADQTVQVTENECSGENPPDPCAFGSTRPIFGEDDELYMVRMLRSASGEEEIAVSAISTGLFELRYFTVPAGARSIYPNSVFQGSLIAGYVDQVGTPDEIVGFYAMNISTGDRLENEIQIRDPGFCHDATIMGFEGTDLVFVDVGGNQVDRIALPAEYGQEVLSAECSLMPKTVDS